MHGGTPLHKQSCAFQLRRSQRQEGLRTPDRVVQNLRINSLTEGSPHPGIGGRISSERRLLGLLGSDQ